MRSRTGWPLIEYGDDGEPQPVAEEDRHEEIAVVEVAAGYGTLQLDGHVIGRAYAAATPTEAPAWMR